MRFNDRTHAGNLLAQKLLPLVNEQMVILGLARGGVVVARSIGDFVKLPIDVLVIKKLSSPYEPEFAIGAVAPDGVFVVHGTDAQRVGVDEDAVAGAVEAKRREIKKNMMLFRKGKGLLEVKEKHVMLVDDGAATGASMEAAILWAKKKKAKKIVVTVPVLSAEAYGLLRPEVDECIALSVEPHLRSIGAYYVSFEQVSDEMVIQLLRI